jgi:hypothetical protein
MTPEQIDEVWSMLDVDYLREVARRGPEPVFATISGAHLYGSASPDSDVDLRGAFLLPARAVSGCIRRTRRSPSKTRVASTWIGSLTTFGSSRG